MDTEALQLATIHPDTLPAGYATVCGIACHVAKLRRFTKNLRRFLAYAPMAEELLNHEPQSPEWVAIVERCDDITSLLSTQHELSGFLIAAGESLRAEVERLNPDPEAA